MNLHLPRIAMRYRLVPAALCTLALVGVTAGAANAQDASPVSSQPVRSQLLTDSIFAGAQFASNELTLAPGAVLTNPHRHPGDLFGYIIEGAILTGLENGEPVRYDAGEMFYEPRGILHTHFQNASETEPARVLIILLTKPDP